MIRNQQHGALFLVTIARPDKANSLSRTMLQDLSDALDRADIRVANPKAPDRGLIGRTCRVLT